MEVNDGKESAESDEEFEELIHTEDDKFLRELLCQSVVKGRRDRCERLTGCGPAASGLSLDEEALTIPKVTPSLLTLKTAMQRGDEDLTLSLISSLECMSTTQALQAPESLMAVASLAFSYNRNRVLTYLQKTAQNSQWLFLPDIALRRMEGVDSFRIHAAILRGDLERAIELIQHARRVWRDRAFLLKALSYPDMAGRTPLTWAALLGYDDVVAALLSSEIGLDWIDWSGGTPTLWAARRGHTNVARLLLFSPNNQRSMNDEAANVLIQATL